MDLKEFLKLDRDKIKLSVTIITMSILLGIFGIYFTRFHSLDFVWIFPGLFLIIIYFFIFPSYYPWIYCISSDPARIWIHGLLHNSVFISVQCLYLVVFMFTLFPASYYLFIERDELMIKKDRNPIPLFYTNQC